MKVFILYILGDYAQAIYMSKYKNACETEKQRLMKNGVVRPMWIEEYDFSKHNSFELESD
jgi:hypothetical protein